MRDKYEMQLRKLHAEMIEMGTMIEQAIETAIKALVAQDTELAKKAIEADDAIDHQEREIENLCLKLFLTQQPVAGDMRNISAALKMITDMERIGDQAEDITKAELEQQAENIEMPVGGRSKSELQEALHEKAEE